MRPLLSGTYLLRIHMYTSSSFQKYEDRWSFGAPLKSHAVSTIFWSSCRRIDGALPNRTNKQPTLSCYEARPKVLHAFPFLPLNFPKRIRSGPVVALGLQAQDPTSFTHIRTFSRSQTQVSAQDPARPLRMGLFQTHTFPSRSGYHLYLFFVAVQKGLLRAAYLPLLLLPLPLPGSMFMGSSSGSCESPPPSGAAVAALAGRRGIQQYCIAGVGAGHSHKG